MKYLTCALLLVVSFFKITMAQNQQGFEIKGALKGLRDNTKVSLITKEEPAQTYLDIRELKDTVVATTLAKNGSFSFTGYIPNPAKVYRIKIDGEGGELVLVMMNERINLKGDLFDWPRINVEGSTYFAERRIVERKFALIRNQYVREEANLSDSARMVYIVDFVKSRKNSKYIPYLYLLHDFPVEQKKTFYEELTPEVKSSYYGIQLHNDIMRLQDLNLIKLGMVIPAFNLLTSDGNKVSIFDVIKKSKFTILYFWFRAGSPAWVRDLSTTKELYEKFDRNDLTIININIDKRIDEWKPGMQEFTGPGMQTRFEIPGDQMKLFDIGGTTSYIVLDNKGHLLSYQFTYSRVSPIGNLLGRMDLPGFTNKFQTLINTSVNN